MQILPRQMVAVLVLLTAWWCLSLESAASDFAFRPGADGKDSCWLTLAPR